MEKKPAIIQWKWREGEMSVKSFYQLPVEEKRKYISQLELLAPDILGTQDEYLLRFFGTRKKNNFYSIDKVENL